MRPLFLFCLLGVLLPLSGGRLHADASFEMDLGPQPPPPPPPDPPAAPGQDAQQPAYAAPGPGADWIEGHWEWQNGGWVWWPGYWDYPPDPTVTWIYGGTVFVDGRYLYQRGHWGRRGERSSRTGGIVPREGSPGRTTAVTPSGPARGGGAVVPANPGAGGGGGGRGPGGGGPGNR